MKYLLGAGGIAGLCALALSPYNPLLFLDRQSLAVFLLAVIVTVPVAYAAYLHLRVKQLTVRNILLQSQADTCRRSEEAARQELLNVQEDMRIWQKTLAAERLVQKTGQVTPRRSVVEFDPESTENKDRKRITRALSREKVTAALSWLDEEDEDQQGGTLPVTDELDS